MKKTCPLFYSRNCIKIVDQRRLPLKLIYIYCRNEKDVFDAIKKMKIRGAPAIGIAGAFGVYLGIKCFKSGDKKKFFKKLDDVVSYLAKSRPTAVNLFWALREMKQELLASRNLSVAEIGRAHV